MQCSAEEPSDPMPGVGSRVWWGHELGVMNSSTKKKNKGEEEGREGREAKKSGTHFLQMLQMLKTMANLGIVEKINLDRSMGGSGSWYKWKVKLSQTVKNLRNIFIARLAKSMILCIKIHISENSGKITKY